MKKSRLLLSVVSILLVFCLMAGGTMAWFTDTEKVQGDFSAGVLDITLTPGEMTNVPLTFQNLRPMEYEAFQAEINAAGNGNLHTEGYAPAPQYFQPVVIKNAGTLPVYLEVSTEALDMDKANCPSGGEEKITLGEEGNYDKVAWDKTGKDGSCANGLIEALNIVLFEKIDGVWTVVSDNLNAASGGTPYEPGIVIPAATGEKTYVVGAYLPGETTGNGFQGKHYHGSLVVNAVQTDVGAGTPEQPDLPELTKEITVEWHHLNDELELEMVGSYPTSVTFPEGKATISVLPDKSKVPEGYGVTDMDGVTIDRGADKVQFLVEKVVIIEPEDPLNKELTKTINVRWYTGPYRDMIDEVIEIKTIEVTFPAGQLFTAIKLSELEPPEGYKWADPPVLVTDTDWQFLFRTTEQFDVRAIPV